MIQQLALQNQERIRYKLEGSLYATIFERFADPAVPFLTTLHIGKKNCSYCIPYLFAFTLQWNWLMSFKLSLSIDNIVKCIRHHILLKDILKNNFYAQKLKTIT